MASSITPIGSSSASSEPVSSPSTNPSTADPMLQKDVFLQLLVSQLKNQDPLNPMDSMNFVTQLAQFSQLEAILGMRTDIHNMAQSEASLANAVLTPQTSET